MLIDTGSTAGRKRYEALAEERHETLAKLFSSLSVDNIEILTNTDYVRDIVRLFAERAKRR